MRLLRAATRVASRRPGGEAARRAVASESGAAQSHSLG